MDEAEAHRAGPGVMARAEAALLWEERTGKSPRFSQRPWTRGDEYTSGSLYSVARAAALAL